MLSGECDRQHREDQMTALDDEQQPSGHLSMRSLSTPSSGVLAWGSVCTRWGSAGAASRYSAAQAGQRPEGLALSRCETR